MPFTFLAHQAPVAPLKLWRPAWFCGTSLAIGSMAPDFEYFLRGDPWAVVGHDVLGQLTFCLPLTLVLVLLFERVLAEPIALHLPDLGPFHLRDFATLARRREPVGQWLAKAIPSALLGSFSHLLLDAFTHEDRFGAKLVPIIKETAFTIAGHEVPWYRLFQHGGTLVCSAITVAILFEIGRKRRLLEWAGERPPEPAKSTPASLAALLVPCLIFAIAGIAWAILARDGEPITTAVRAFLRASTLGFAGLCVGAVAARKTMA
jgi:hypothetical protein